MKSKNQENENSRMALKKEKVLMIGKGAQSSILELLSNRLEVARTGRFQVAQCASLESDVQF